MRVFSGIQPTGFLTIGNYFGALKNWIKIQNDYECIFSIVDLHAITAAKDPKELSNAILRTLASYIAAGINPSNTIIFQQSAIFEHLHLSWIFSCLTQLGWLNRMTQFKDKAGKNQSSASLGLYSYPVLMASDILLYHADLIPVGEDQKQHIELARDIALAFNRQYNLDYFKLPNILMNSQAKRIMSLRDGRKKMSKSDPSDESRINITDSNDQISRKIKKAKTDSLIEIYFDEENRPEISNLINIYCLLTNQTLESSQEELRTLSTKSFKERLTDLLIAEIDPIATLINQLEKDRSYLEEILKEGKDKSSILAHNTIKEINRIVGFNSFPPIA